MTGIVGAEQGRVDGWEKVTGLARYAADLSLGRCYHARVFRSTEAHAIIRNLDVRRARAAPGVRAVVTGDDFSGLIGAASNGAASNGAARQERFLIGAAIRDQPPIARGRVRFWGEPLAVVIASSEQAAEQALELIEVEYQPLEAALHPRQAALPGAPIIHPDLASYSHDRQVHPQPGTNICHRYQLRRGDVAAAFAAAHLVVENEYWSPWIAHTALEPHCSWALWEGGSVSIWTSSQAPFFVRETVAHMFGLSPANVRVIVPYVGGGFGGKSDVTIEPLLALAARATPGVPVRLLLTREELYFGTVVGRGAWGRVKTAVDRDGMLTALEAELYFGSGAYADYSVWIAQGGGHNATGPYYIPNISIASHSVYTNTPPTGAFRGYGHPEVHWMGERQMDQIARRLGMDPAELRLKNLLLPGKVNALGQTLRDSNGRADLCLKAVVERLGPVRPASAPGRRRAHGLASFMKSPVMRTNAQSGAILRFNDDGSVTLFTGAVEIGQGSNTVLTQIAAEALGIPVEKVHYAQGVDTEFSPHEWQTVASHTTWAVGNAVRLAALDAISQIKQAASQVLEAPVSRLETAGGSVFANDRPEQALPFTAFATGYTRPDGSAVNPPVIGRGSFVPLGLTFPDPGTGQGNMAASWTFGCQGADVEVDLETGQVFVLRLVSAQDAGRILNPETARGQIEGAMIQALGAALTEKIHYDPQGRMLNASLVDYRIPTSTDIPEMEVIFIETEDATGPFGARGLGEHGIVAVPAAIANALAAAIGYEAYELPLEPGRIMEFIEEVRKTKSY